MLVKLYKNTIPNPVADIYNHQLGLKTGNKLDDQA